MQENRILHTKSVHRMFLGSVQTSVVGLSHRFHMPSDAGSQLKSLSVFLGRCHENMHGTTEVILKRNANIPADANAVSVLVADLDKFSEEGMQISECVLLLKCFIFHGSFAEKDICFFIILINNHVQCP